MKGKWIKWTVAAVALVGAGLTFWMLSSTTGPRQKDQDAIPAGTFVKTQSVDLYTGTPVVQAAGFVEPRYSLVVRPQVSGRITWMNPAMTAGGTLKKDEVIFKIDPRDYRNALKKAEAGLVKAEASLRLEQGRGKAAEKEWTYFKARNPEKKRGNRNLALRGPQLESALAAVNEMNAAVDQARLNLARTRIRSPFHAIVLENTAAPGMLADPRTKAGILISTKAFDIKAKIDISKLAFIKFPDRKSEKGAQAVVTMKAGGTDYRYEGYVTDLVPSVEKKGRMAQVVISVPDPLTQNEKQPLLLNTFVSVEIASSLESRYVAVPRKAVRYKSRIYLYEDGRLRIVSPDIIWRLSDVVLVEDAIRPGDEVITSPVSSPVEGMALNRAQERPGEKTP